MEKKEKIDQEDNILNAGIAGAAYEVIQRYGSAAKQHFVAYEGVDNETGKVLVKGLKQISEYNINPDYEFNNIHQQAGFSAEVKDVAKTNAANIISGSKVRKIRTDDIGKVNDQLFDTVMLDENGKIIEGSGAQMKFIGASEKDPAGLDDSLRAFNKLLKPEYDKYFDNDVKISVPSNQYDGIINEANTKLEKLNKQLEYQKKVGNTEQTGKIQKQIDKINKIKSNLRKSTLTSDEAVYAREHPQLSTAKDVAKISHQAGIKTAQNAAIIGGSVSIVKNIVSVCKGEIEADKATLNVARDTATTALVGYGTGFSGSAIKGAMQNSEKEYIRTLSRTNVSGTVVAVAVASSKTLLRYFHGEINGVECFEELGEQGTGMISSAMFTVVGQLAVPIPVIGGMIGGMMGYALSSATYGILMSSLKEEQLAHEQRVEIEKICEEHIKMLRTYKKEVDEIVNKYLTDSMEIFRDSFSGIKNALQIGDVDWFIESTNTITETFGGKSAFKNFDDFDNKMIHGETFKL